MDIAGTYTFDAPPDRVWALLMDPAVISSCIPGCDSFEPDGENRYRVRLQVAMAEGKGRPGFLNGSSDITLRAEGVTTVVDVAGTVQTGGPIARLGQRLIGGVSKMMLDRFFACLQSKLATHAS
jgi:carbon monoxide dehydrogenase subunit G